MSAKQILICYWACHFFKRVITQLAAPKLQQKEVSLKPKYTAFEHVSIIIPTIDPDDGLEATILSVVRARPLELIIVTDEYTFESISNHVKNVLTPLLDEATFEKTHIPNVTVHNVPKASKRQQMVKGIQVAQGEIIVFADDDVLWPENILQHVLACFEEPTIGGVGVLQESQIQPFAPKNMWHFLDTLQLSSRMITIAATSYIDGGMTSISGRTAAYRTEILKDEKFMQAFTNDRWLDRYLLDSGDDVFITHWLFDEGWDLRLQTDPSAMITTSSTGSIKYLWQRLRRARNSKRGQIRCLVKRPWMWLYPFTMLLMTDSLFVSAMRFLTFALLYSFVGFGCWQSYGIMILLQAASVVQKALEDIVYGQSIEFWLFYLLLAPLLIPCLDIYVLLTLHVHTWGSRQVESPKSNQV